MSATRPRMPSAVGIYSRRSSPISGGLTASRGSSARRSSGSFRFRTLFYPQSIPPNAGGHDPHARPLDAFSEAAPDSLRASVGSTRGRLGSIGFGIPDLGRWSPARRKRRDRTLGGRRPRSVDAGRRTGPDPRQINRGRPWSCSRSTGGPSRPTGGDRPGARSAHPSPYRPHRTRS